MPSHFQNNDSLWCDDDRERTSDKHLLRQKWNSVDRPADCFATRRNPWIVRKWSSSNTTFQGEGWLLEHYALTRNVNCKSRNLRKIGRLPKSNALNTSCEFPNHCQSSRSWYKMNETQILCSEVSVICSQLGSI